MSIIGGMHEIIDTWLETEGVGTRSPHYENKEACLLVSERTMSPAPAPIADLLHAIAQKWMENDKPDLVRRVLGSTANWRFEHCPKIDPSNKSVEKRLEKRFATEDSPDWANQVPVASGAASPYSDRKTSIDLVRRIHKGSEYVFYELKIGSDNPLHAAIEVLRYGIIYLAARDRVAAEPPDSLKLVMKDKELLQASCIHLAVLAPESFYRGDERYNLDLLTKAINDGLESFLACRSFVLTTMDFTFEALPEDWETLDIIPLQSAIANQAVFRWAD
jgi:hypothetical protein